MALSEPEPGRNRDRGGRCLLSTRVEHSEVSQSLSLAHPAPAPTMLPEPPVFRRGSRSWSIAAYDAVSERGNEEDFLLWYSEGIDEELL